MSRSLRSKVNDQGNVWNYKPLSIDLSTVSIVDPYLLQSRIYTRRELVVSNRSIHPLGSRTLITKNGVLFWHQERERERAV
jgi:hypothetical protein